MLREDKETQKLLERELTIQTNKLNELVEMVRSGKEWDFSKQSRPGLLLLYAHQIQALNEILTRNYLAIQPYRKELSGKQQNTLDSILDGNLKTKNAIVYLTEFEPKEIKEQISESAREFGLDTFEIGENVKDTETQASITKSLQNFAANSKRAMDTYNQNARLKGEPTRTLKNSVKADYDPSTKRNRSHLPGQRRRNRHRDSQEKP